MITPISDNGSDLDDPHDSHDSNFDIIGKIFHTYSLMDGEFDHFDFL